MGGLGALGLALCGVVGVLEGAVVGDGGGGGVDGGVVGEKEDGEIPIAVLRISNESVILK